MLISNRLSLSERSRNLCSSSSVTNSRFEMCAYPYFAFFRVPNAREGPFSAEVSPRLIGMPLLRGCHFKSKRTSSIAQLRSWQRCAFLERIGSFKKVTPPTAQKCSSIGWSRWPYESRLSTQKLPSKVYAAPANMSCCGPSAITSDFCMMRAGSWKLRGGDGRDCILVRWMIEAPDAREGYESARVQLSRVWHRCQIRELDSRFRLKRRA